MRIYDITLPVTNDMPVWPGDPHVNVERIAKMEDGSVCNISHMAMGVHTGTHMDAPYHFLGGEAATIEKLPLKLLTGRAYVMHLPHTDLITAADLEASGLPPRTRRLLLKTRNSGYWAAGNLKFQENFVAISPDGARYLVEHGVRLVGVDYLSVAPFADGVPTHQILLEAGVVVVEGLDLSQVGPGRYTLHCLPMKLVGSDGAPARAILVGV
jgi:arylformamidase